MSICYHLVVTKYCISRPDIAMSAGCESQTVADEYYVEKFNVFTIPLLSFPYSVLFMLTLVDGSDFKVLKSLRLCIILSHPHQLNSTSKTSLYI